MILNQIDSAKFLERKTADGGYSGQRSQTHSCATPLKHRRRKPVAEIAQGQAFPLFCHNARVAPPRATRLQLHPGFGQINSIPA
jgi:hypothetical protein